VIDNPPVVNNPPVNSLPISNALGIDFTELAQGLMLPDSQLIQGIGSIATGLPQGILPNDQSLISFAGLANNFMVSSLAGII
jgi:hypothetical protein